MLARQTQRLDGGAPFDPAASTAAAPKEAQLKAYQAAEWTAFAFGILGAWRGVAWRRACRVACRRVFAYSHLVVFFISIFGALVPWLGA